MTHTNINNTTTHDNNDNNKHPRSFRGLRESSNPDQGNTNQHIMNNTNTNTNTNNTNTTTNNDNNAP